MKKSTRALAVILVAAPLLAACSSTCNCPKCPNSTVMTPPHSTTYTYTSPNA